MSTSLDRFVRFLEDVPESIIQREDYGISVSHLEEMDFNPPLRIMVTNDQMDQFINSLGDAEESLWPGTPPERVAFNLLSVHLIELASTRNLEHGGRFELTSEGLDSQDPIQAPINLPYDSRSEHYVFRPDGP